MRFEYPTCEPLGKVKQVYVQGNIASVDDGEITCPNCYIAEIEQGERTPLPQSAVLGAKDLPRTILSDQIEQRLFKKLKQERLERARVQGRSYDEVLQL